MSDLQNEFILSLQQLYSKPPTEIYHYTDTKGLIGIVTTGRIRVTHAQFMNDMTEFTHGKEIVCKCLDDAARKESDSKISDLFKWAKTHLIDQVYEQFDIYLACFTEEIDSLNQWRAYGNNGRGYIIGFDVGDDYGFKKEYI